MFAPKEDQLHECVIPKPALALLFILALCQGRNGTVQEETLGNAHITP